MTPGLRRLPSRSRPRTGSRVGPILRLLLDHPAAAVAAVSAGLAAPLAAVVAAAIRELLDPRLANRSGHVLVLGRGSGALALLRGKEATRAGRYGLFASGSSAVVGEVLDAGALRVRREVLTGAVPAPARAVADKAVWRGDPRSTWGLDFRDVEIPGDLGPLPAWHVPGDADIWVLLAHGHGGGRHRCLRPLRAIAEAGMPALVVSWRNDGTAPDSRDRRYHLGDTEWRDLDAAARWALSHGARRIVPYGYSMGGAIVGMFLRRSEAAAAVAGVVLDAPVLDWAAVLGQEFRDFHLPLPVTPLALTTWLTELRLGVRLDELNLIDHPEALDPYPTLVFQGLSDTTCPANVCQNLAQRLGDRLTVVETQRAGHELSWNVDPQRYERQLRAFLGRVRSGEGDEGRRVVADPR